MVCLLDNKREMKHYLTTRKAMLGITEVHGQRASGLVAVVKREYKFSVEKLAVSKPFRVLSPEAYLRRRTMQNMI